MDPNSVMTAVQYAAQHGNSVMLSQIVSKADAQLRQVAKTGQESWTAKEFRNAVLLNIKAEAQHPTPYHRVFQGDALHHLCSSAIFAALQASGIPGHQIEAAKGKHLDANYTGLEKVAMTAEATAKRGAYPQSRRGQARGRGRFQGAPACFTCGSTTHLQRDCPAAQNAQQPSNPYQQPPYAGFQPFGATRGNGRGGRRF